MYLKWYLWEPHPKKRGVKTPNLTEYLIQLLVETCHYTYCQTQEPNSVGYNELIGQMKKKHFCTSPRSLFFLQHNVRRYIIL